MTCESVRDRLDGYVAGTLDDASASDLRRHLEQCDECRADEAAARFLTPRVVALPRSVPPARPLWDGIESRLVPRQATRRFTTWLPLAATLALLAGAGWWWLRQADAPVGVAVETPAALPSQAAAYKLAASDLQTSLLDQGKLEPTTANALRRDLATMDNAIAETSNALQGDPANEVLQQLHLSALRRKLDVLRRTAALYVES
jgi:anti-sigma factor RsiW